MKKALVSLTALVALAGVAACADTSQTYRNGSDPVTQPNTVTTTQVKTVERDGRWVNGTYHKTEDTYMTERTLHENKYIPNEFAYKRAY